MFLCECLTVSLIMKMAFKTLFLSTLRFIDQVDLTLGDDWSPGGAVFFSIHR